MKKQLKSTIFVYFNNNFYYYLSSALSWNITNRIVVIPYDVSGQPIGPTFKDQEVHNSKYLNYFVAEAWKHAYFFVFIVHLLRLVSNLYILPV
jgi:hypothetical protein